MDLDIITGKEVNKGYRVKEDIVIRTIAWIKKKAGLYQGNNLYVAEESLEEYKKRRSRFERYAIFGTIFVFVVLVFSILLPITSGDYQKIISNIVAVLGLTFVTFFLVLFSYMPAIEDKITIIREEKKKEEKENKEADELKKEAKEREIKEKEEKKDIKEKKTYKRRKK